MNDLTERAHEDRVRLVKKSALHLSEKSLDLTDRDFDLAAAAMAAYKNSRMIGDAPAAIAAQEVESDSSFASARILLEKEASSEIRKGIKTDLLFSVAPTAILVTVLALFAYFQQTVVSFKAVSIAGSMLVALCVVAVGGTLGFGRSTTLRTSRLQPYLATSVGSLVGGICLFVCAGMLLSYYTKDRQRDAIQSITRELRLFDSAVALSAVAEQQGFERRAALALAAKEAGVRWKLENSSPGDVRMVATSGLPEGHGAVTLSYESASRAALRPFARLEARNGNLSASHEYILGRVNSEYRGTGTIELSSIGEQPQVMSYSVGDGLAVPPPETVVVATLKNGKVVNLEPVDWLAARLPEPQAASQVAPGSSPPKK